MTSTTQQQSSYNSEGLFLFVAGVSGSRMILTPCYAMYNLQPLSLLKWTLQIRQNYRNLSKRASTFCSKVNY